jgi:ABC-type transport system involved in multi-copper enzyme maturation permease subunit
MAKQISLGPVFESEWLAVSRRWQWYAARSILVLAVLFAVSVLWWGRTRRAAGTVQGQAEIGRLLCGAITVTQLAIVLLVAPAATAGAICLDRIRGTLAHMLITDLSSTEIVLGKLAARMLHVLGILFCVLPVLSLGALLGGIDPPLIVGAMLVTLGAAVSGCAAALTLSTWGTKTHEVLLATYAAWALWLLVLPMWWGGRLVIGGVAAPPTWVANANPIWLVAAPYVWPGSVVLDDQVRFLGASFLASVGLAALAATQLRRVATCSGSDRRAGSRSFPGARIFDRVVGLLPGPSLDNNPVLWREWHRRRPSRWARIVWLLYGSMAFALSTTLIVINLNGGGVLREVASFGNGFQAGIGLLLLSVSAATALAEERVRGNLDVLLATPLSTRSIVWGKWWGTFRTVPLLAIAPGAVAATLARDSGRWDGAALIVGLFIAYGAAVTSLGLGLSTWMRRLDHAVAANVAVLGGVTVGWFLFVMLTTPGDEALGLAAGSPIVGIVFPTIAMRVYSTGEWDGVLRWWGLWIITYSAVAAALAWATLMTFDRCLRRSPDHP